MLVDFGRDFMDLLLSPASKVLNKWFEVCYLTSFLRTLFSNSKKEIFEKFFLLIPFICLYVACS